MTKGLIIVDVQNDFCEGGSLAVPRSLEIIPLINFLKKQKHFFSHVFLSKDWHPEDHVSFAKTHNKKPFETIQIEQKVQELWPTHCVAESFGAQLHPDLQRDENDIIIQKGIYKHVDSYSAFYVGENGVELKKALEQKGITEVYVCGLATDYCVGSTALDAKGFGFKTYVIKQACKGVANETIDSMMKRLYASGVGIISIKNLNI